MKRKKRKRSQNSVAICEINGHYLTQADIDHHGCKDSFKQAIYSRERCKHLKDLKGEENFDTEQSPETA